MEPLVAQGTSPKGMLAGVEKDGRIRIGEYTIDPADFKEAVDCEQFVQMEREGTHPKYLSVNKIASGVGIGSSVMTWDDWRRVCKIAGVKSTDGPEAPKLQRRGKTK